MNKHINFLKDKIACQKIIIYLIIIMIIISNIYLNHLLKIGFLLLKLNFGLK